LSGGEQQRVALARALVIEPRLLLLDEPLASLDRRLRESMRQELRALHQRTGVATVLVTHDQEDALFLADRIGVMAHGRLLQVGTPTELYQRPALPFVARFLGDANFLTGAAAFAPLLEPLQPLSADVCVLVRPEHCRLSLQPQPHSAPGVVGAVTFMGADRLLDVELAPTHRVLVRARPEHLPASPLPSVGSTVHLSIAPESAWVLPQRDPVAWSAA
jgi:ABC-type Fe3+/spermidine/putrescine transport system ATPase subunit